MRTLDSSLAAALITAMVLSFPGCGQGDDARGPEKSPKSEAGQHLAIMVVLPADVYSEDEKQEKMLSLKGLVEEKRIGRVVETGTRRAIIEVVFQVTTEGDARGLLRRALLEWDPSLSYTIEERLPGM